MKQVFGDLWALWSSKMYDAVCITTNGAVRVDGACVMGRGCAKEFAERFPDGPFDLGQLIDMNGNITQVIYRNLENDKEATVAFPVKHLWHEAADIELIQESAKQLVELADKYKWEKVLLPRPGCGNGKLEWGIVAPIIGEILDDRFDVVTWRKDMKTIMVTGHRPTSKGVAKLYGYDIHHKAYNGIRKWMQAKFEELKPDRLITGMALGADQIFCEEALAYRDTHPGVIVEAAIPFRRQAAYWKNDGPKEYFKLLKRCDVRHYVSDKRPGNYRRELQARNEYMVDEADIILAVWDGSDGGTANCLKYAKDKGKGEAVHQIRPNPDKVKMYG